MGDVLIILWLPATIAFMAVAFVVTLGAAGGSIAVEPVRPPPAESNGAPGGPR